ncbi:MAG: hypothetical protein ACK54X_05840 [Burkholderiales bacterium]|jgi:hypothetical protein
MAAPPPAPPPAPLPPWSDALAPIAGAIEGALAISARAVGRLSAQANGVRFGAVQKQEDTFRAELRAVRRQAGEPGVDPAGFAARLRSLLEQVERFAGPWIAAAAAPVPAAATSAPADAAPVPAAATPADATPATAEATSTDAPSADAPSAPADTTRVQAATPEPLTVQQVASVRQGVTRAMVVLAQAPLHLRLEFGPGFADPHPDVLLLAARMHAIHRAVRGSLKQVSWKAPDRADLAFGDGDPARTVEAVFDAQGRLQVPDSVRQDKGRGTAPGGTPPGSPAGRARPGPPTDRRGRDRRTSPPKGAPAGRPQPGAPTGRPPVTDDARSQGAQGRPSPDRGGRPHGRGRPDGRSGPPSPNASPSSNRPPSPSRSPSPDRPPLSNRPPQSNRPPSPNGPQRPEDRGRPRDGAPRRPGAMPGSSGVGASVRDDRRPPKPRAPINPLLADKLRAVLAATSGPKPATETVDTPDAGEPSVPKEGGSA